VVSPERGKEWVIESATTVGEVGPESPPLFEAQAEMMAPSTTTTVLPTLIVRWLAMRFARFLFFAVFRPRFGFPRSPEAEPSAAMSP